jgi:uncharacterized protein with GYD domain
MPKYLIQGSYTQAGIQGVLKDGGTARVKAVESLLASVGGSLESFYFAFGSDDFHVIVDGPSNIVAAAVAATIGGSGAVSARTVVLLTPAEMDEAIKLHPAYRAPGA